MVQALLPLLEPRQAMSLAIETENKTLASHLRDKNQQFSKDRQEPCSH